MDIMELTIQEILDLLENIGPDNVTYETLSDDDKKLVDDLLN